ncbi:MAG: hypothetical protein QXE80_02385 [Pyrobaculum sp.]
MKSVDKKILTSIALLMLEELAIRGGKIKPKYWKTYRLANFWFGSEVTSHILNKLIEGGYIKIQDSYIVLIKAFRPQKSLGSVLRGFYTLLASGISQ